VDRAVIKVESPYFMSVAQNSHYLTNKPEADGELILPPSLHKCSVLRVFKDIYQATRKRRSRNKDLRSHQGIDLRISRTDGRALTNHANPCPCNSLLV